MFKTLYALIVLVFISMAANGCNYPKDARGTLEKIRKTKTIKAGISENKPWTYFENGIPKGVEVNIVNEIARHLGAKVIWRQGTTDKLLASLERAEIDIVVAGMTDESPWKDKIGFSIPYYTDTILIGVPGAVTKPDIEKLYIGVKDGTLIPRYIKELGAKPIRVDSLSKHDGPVAGSVAELKKLGLKLLYDDILFNENHVIAVVPGENAWLVYIEKFMSNNEYLIKRWIARGTYE